jgi:predicted transcriptional regulator
LYSFLTNPIAAVQPEMKRVTNIRLPEDIDLKLRIKAAENRQQISSLATEAITYYLNHYEAINSIKEAS